MIEAPKGEFVFTIKKFPIWSVEIDDVEGATTGLFKLLADAGANIEFALGRPQTERPGKAILFVSPIKGKEQEAAARQADFIPRPDVVGIQVQGPNKVGGNFRLTAALAHANLAVRALLTTVDDDRFTAVFALNSDKDADEAAKVLRKVLD
jgi:hypothetical protein